VVTKHYIAAPFALLFVMGFGYVSALVFRERFAGVLAAREEEARLLAARDSDPSLLPGFKREDAATDSVAA
jgi:hypothetical protein